MPFVCECGSEDFYTHSDEETIMYVNGYGEVYDSGDIVNNAQTFKWPYRCCECDKAYSQIPPKNIEGEWIENCKHSYLNDTNKCPICKSTDISGDSIEVDGEQAWQNIDCGNCGARWIDIYYLRAVEIAEYPPDMAPQEEIPSDDEVPNPNDAFKETL